MGVGDGAQDDGVEDAEDRRVHTDAERQRQDHDCREPGTTTESAERVARVLQQLIDPQRDSHKPHPPSRSRYCVELEHSLTARVLVTSAGRYCPRFLARRNADLIPDRFRPSFASERRAKSPTLEQGRGGTALPHFNPDKSPSVYQLHSRANSDANARPPSRSTRPSRRFTAHRWGMRIRLWHVILSDTAVVLRTP